METVLLYQIKGTKTAVLLKPVLLKLGIRVRIVEPEQYLQSIGFLAGNKAFAESPEAYDGAGFDEPMMVMAGFSERKLDLFLTEMRRKKVPPIALKAIVTTQNQAWNSLQLYRELKEEHEKMKWSGQKIRNWNFFFMPPLPIIGCNQGTKVPDTKGVSCYEK